MRVTELVDNPPRQSQQAVTPTMMRKTLATSTALLIATLATAGLAIAEPLALVTGDGGGHAAGTVDGSYHADATGAVDAADETNQEAQAHVNEQARSTSEAYEETKWRAYDNATDIEQPQAPQCTCDEATGQLDQAGTMQASHADRVHKAANVETEYVDAGADVNGAAQADAWYENLFEGAKTLVDDARGLLGYETHADQEAKDTARSTLEAEDRLRGELVEQAHLDQDLPEAEPKLDGELSAKHATDIATSAAGNGEIQP